MAGMRKARPPRGEAGPATIANVPRRQAGIAVAIVDETPDIRRELRPRRPVPDRPPARACPCGCTPDGPCVTERPALTGSHCPCAGLGIAALRRPQAVTWHAAGHPNDWGLAS